MKGCDLDARWKSIDSALKIIACTLEWCMMCIKESRIEHRFICSV